MQDPFSDDDDEPEVELDEEGLPEGAIPLKALEAMSPEEQTDYQMMTTFDTEEGTWMLPIRLCLDADYQPSTPSEATILIAGHENVGWFEIKFPPEGEEGDVTHERFTYH